MIDILVLEPQRLIEHLGTQSRVSDRPLAIETPSIVARQVDNRNAANGTWSYPQNHTDIAKGIAKNTFELSWQHTDSGFSLRVELLMGSGR